MSAARIWLVAATLALSACAGGGIPPPPAPAPPPPPPSPSTYLSLAPEPDVTAVAPAPPKPTPAAVPPPSAAPPAPQAVSEVAQPVVKTPAPIAPAPQAAAPPAESLTLDLTALKKQLKETKSIGIFSKISLKNKVDDLLSQFRKYYQGKGKMDMAQLRESYNLLMMKVLSMLQDADQTLSAAIVSSREAIWGLLSDPKKFAALDI